MVTTFQKVEPISKRSRVIELFKGAILSGVLKSSDQIVEAKMAQQFGVGQGLIREALIELEHQGFVQRIPFSGTQVTEIKLENAEQIFEIRIELEPLAFRLAVQHASPEELVELVGLVAEMKRGAEESDVGRFFDNNVAYRRRVWELSRNRYLLQTLERLVVPLFALYLMRASFDRETFFQTIKDCAVEQERTVRAMQAGEAVEAGRLVREFLETTKNNLGTKLHLTT